ncbi:hypothetical protein BC829DRAFT_19373 [Chytridium lagenaria]|nr:hypothetical protein BC829DRAFT_19373 [Chytridium lagenaria]
MDASEIVTEYSDLMLNILRISWSIQVFLLHGETNLLNLCFENTYHRRVPDISSATTAHQSNSCANPRKAIRPS